MNVLADEGVDRSVVERLRRDGHDVLYAAEFVPGTSDDDVLRRANEKSALLLTADKDFGELVVRLRRFSAGVVLVRLGGLPPDSKAEIVSVVLREHGGEMTNSFTVISRGAVRIRRLA